VTEIELGYLETENNNFDNNTAIRLHSEGMQFNAVITPTPQGRAFQFNAFMEGSMSDFNGAKPVMTVRDNEFKMKLVDGASGATATKILSIVGEGDAFSAGTNDLGIPCIVKDSSGNAKILVLDAAGALPISDNGGSLTVDASDLDIRDLSETTDAVTAHQGGAWSVTATATDLDIRDIDAAQDNIAISDGTDTLAINSDGSINSVVTATDLDIRDLTHASDSVKIGDGTDFLAISTDGEGSVRISKAQAADGATAPTEAVQVAGKDGSGNLQVLKTNTSGQLEVVQVSAVALSDVLDYKTSATVGVGSPVNHDYIVTDTKTFKGLFVTVGARGAVKVEVGTWDGTTFVPKMVYFQDPKENIDHQIPKLKLLGDATAAIRIKITNLDGQTSDVYSTLQGYEE